MDTSRACSLNWDVLWSHGSRLGVVYQFFGEFGWVMWLVFTLPCFVFNDR